MENATEKKILMQTNRQLMLRWAQHCWHLEILRGQL